MSDAVEGALCEAALAADEACQQYSTQGLQAKMQAVVTGTVEELHFTNGLVTVSYVRCFLERMKERKLLDMGTPILDTYIYMQHAGVRICIYNI